MLRLAVMLTLAWLVGLPASAEEAATGLRVGDYLTPFDVQDCTGPAAGKSLCYYCRYGGRPVVAVFTRELDGEIAKLVKRIDDLVVRNRDKRLAGLVVYLADDPFEADKQLKDFATQHAIVKTPLTVYRDKPMKLENVLKVSPQSAVTVMMWSDFAVRANYSFRSAELPADKIQRIVADAEKMLQK